MGTVDDGIQAFKMSPDGELFVILTGNGKLLEMTVDFDVIADFELRQTQEAEGQVNVGWGKKETQFHGRAGKTAAQEKVSASRSQKDDGQPRISWRGDGNYFTVSTLEEHRVLRVFNREAVMTNKSEPVNGLEHPLSWRPSGNLIASTASTHLQQVVFFERNGLRHGEFNLRDKCIVKDIDWNSDSTILAVHLTKESGENVIQLYSSSNYYWYLQKELTDCDFQCMQWDPEHPYVLHTLGKGLYKRYEFQFAVLQSTLLHDSDAVVAVLDGTDLHLTPFKTRNVPPPMSFAQTKFKSPVVDVAFQSNHRLVALLSHSLQLIGDINTENPTVLGEIALKQDNCTFRQVLWTAEDEFLVLGHNISEHYDFMYLITKEGKQLIDIGDKAPIVMLHHNLQDNIIAFQTDNGSVYQLLHGFPVLKHKLPTNSWIQSSLCGPERDELVFFALNNRNKLFANDRMISSECTSYFVHNEYLIITTLRHTCEFLMLNQHLEEFQFKERTGPFDEKIRKVEQGSKIVTCIPADVNLVLQMPRGNLETISPRALVLSQVRHLIEHLDYKKAFLICRRHRIDLNILIDHHPVQFLENINDIVKMIGNPDHLNLLITSLVNDDICTTMFPAPKKSESPFKFKVNECCTAIQQALEQDPSVFIQPILTCDAKQDPPQLESSMKRIYKIKQTSNQEAEAALVYLIFLADVNKLFDVALGMYDFSLVLMVAQHSQKDPREYIPFLQELSKLEQNYQRYKIDDHLKKYTRALSHLAKCADHFEELLQYTARHDLYKHALTLFEVSDQKHNQIVRQFAQQQQGLEIYAEAGTLFELCGDYEEAIGCYAEGGLWRQAYNLLLLNGSTSLSSIMLPIVEKLQESRDFIGLSQLFVHIFNDKRQAVLYLLQGQYWSDAVLLARQSGLESMIQQDIVPSTVKQAELLIDEVKESHITFNKQRQRLQQVLKEKRESYEKRKLLGMDPRLQDIEMFSDTASMATTVTGSIASSRMSNISSRTARTSRQKRKMAKKRATGKDAAFEDEFLRTQIRQSMLRTNDLKKELVDLLPNLIRFKRLDLVREITVAFRAYLVDIETHAPQVFADQDSIPLFATEEDGEIPKIKIIQQPVLSDTVWWTSTA
ncbi:IKI3 family-domain-containing protein [Gorgonomyces haynaldii]|nr:IKI3 family-domain-containing protein [Gorgonomyces haynaldii]